MSASAVQRQAEAGASILSNSDSRWIRLREIIEQKSLQLGDFILSSGKSSKFLFQLRQTTMLPEGAALIGEIIVEFMRRNSLHCVGGLELGAVPIVSAATVMSQVMGFPVDAFFVRKQAKAHGARERIDGHVRDGDEVLLVDDVATTGNSMFAAIEGLKSEYPKCFVKRALVIVDREEGAAETLAGQGIELVSVFRRSDFGI